MAKWSFRRLVGLSLTLLLLFLSTWGQSPPAQEKKPQPGHVDDASRMNDTRVAEIWDISSDPVKAEAQLQALLRRARADKLHVAIAGARHSMGGHSIYPDGIALNMLPFKGLELDAERRILRVG